MKTVIDVNDIWAGLPVRWSSSVSDDSLRANLVNNAVMRIYLDLNHCFTERIKFPVAKGEIQTINNDSAYIYIKHALYRDKRFPVRVNGDFFEIPIRSCKDDPDDFFELQASVVPRCVEENGKYQIAIDARIKKPLFAALVLECYDLEEDNSDLQNSNAWRQKYDMAINDLRAALAGIQRVEQRFSMNKLGQAFFG